MSCKRIERSSLLYVLCVQRFPITALLLLLFLPKPLLANFNNIDIHSHAAILMEVETKKILYQKNADKRLYPASASKVPAAYYALKRNKQNLHALLEADRDCTGTITKKYREDSKYKYPAHWILVGGTHMSIKIGEKTKLEDLLYDMLLVSANDSANILAKYTSGSVQKFVEEMNAYYKSIGCKKTKFCNPHGLHYPTHLTTAYDMALIACEAVKDPHFRKIFATVKHKRAATNLRDEKWIVNENKMLKPGGAYYYPHAIGGKIGFTDQARSCYVAAAKKDGKTLVLVLLNCPKSHQKYEDAILLFKKGFSKLKEV